MSFLDSADEGDHKPILSGSVQWHALLVWCQEASGDGCS